MSKNNSSAGRHLARLTAGRWTKPAAYGLVLLAAALLQAAPGALPAVFGARPLLLLPVVVGIAMFEGPVFGGGAGAGAGLLWDLYAAHLFGFRALLLLILGCACGLLVRLLIRNNLLSALLLTAGALLAFGLIDWFFSDLLFLKEDALYILFRLALPDWLYSLALTPPLYGLLLSISRALRRSAA